MSESIDTTEVNDENENSTPAPTVEETQEALSDDNQSEEGLATDSDADEERAKGKRRRRTKRKDLPPPDKQSTEALQFVTEVVAKMDMRCKVHLRRPKDDEDRDIRLEITGEDAGRIIGKKGQVLSALQFLANRVLNRPGEERRYVTVDAEGYRSRRDNSLASMAKRLGKQAMADGKIITFEPMPPRDRRVVHLALAKLDGVITKSEGDGDTRRVQIIPVRR